MSPEELRQRLDAFLGVEAEAYPARDPVNQPMIRHWCDAVGDRNPVYTDPEFAKRSVFGGIVAPPTMLQAWTMPGLAPPPRPQSASPHPLRAVIDLLDAAGYTSVVATNCRQEYRRPLSLGDRIQVTSHVESVSDEKKTALGVGRFVDEVMLYRDAQGEEVARMRFRILKFRPRAAAAVAGQGASSAAPAPAAETRAPRAPRRPRPGVSHDNAFFWEGVAARQLRIQRCTGCGRLRHPPGPMCPHCHSLAWDAMPASGRGHVFSFVVAHHPAIPPFVYPHLVVLVELEEGTRLVSNLVGVEPTDVRIGMPVEVEFSEVEPGFVLPLFRPARAGGESWTSR
jgi:uncharacterized OB-fold protein/acyl dehydratase